MAVVGHDYKFLYANAGCKGRISDGGVFRQTDLYADIEKGNLNLPPPKSLPITDGNGHWEKDETPYSYFLVGDSGFALSKYMMKPYDPKKNLTDEERIFNYRLARFRRISENGFGTLVNRFRLWLGRCSLQPEDAEICLMACIALHNMLCTKSKDRYLAPSEVDTFTPTGDCLEGSWRREHFDEWLPSVPISRIRNAGMSAKTIRNNLLTYFARQGSVPWQWEHLIIH